MIYHNETPFHDQLHAPRDGKVRRINSTIHHIELSFCRKQTNQQVQKTTQAVGWWVQCALCILSSSQCFIELPARFALNLCHKISESQRFCGAVKWSVPQLLILNVETRPALRKKKPLWFVQHWSCRVQGEYDVRNPRTYEKYHSRFWGRLAIFNKFRSCSIVPMQTVDKQL